MKYLAATLTAAVLGAAALAAERDKPLKIGVVNIKECFAEKNWSRIGEARATYAAYVKRLREEEPDTKKATQEALERYRKIQSELYNVVRSAINAHAKEHKFDLILKIDEPKLSDVSSGSVAQDINARPVLFHEPSFDITGEVLKRLNAAAEEQGKTDF